MKLLVDIPDNMIPALMSGHIDVHYLIGCIMNGKIIEEDNKHVKRERRNAGEDPVV